jgi:hypothetical protein
MTYLPMLTTRKPLLQPWQPQRMGAKRPLISQQCP